MDIIKFEYGQVAGGYAYGVVSSKLAEPGAYSGEYVRLTDHQNTLAQLEFAARLNADTMKEQAATIVTLRQRESEAFSLTQTLVRKTEQQADTIKALRLAVQLQGKAPCQAVSSEMK